MIIGIGVDIIEIARIERALDEHGDRIRERVFTPAEIRYCQATGRASERYATRFAAKEAARKAFGAARPLLALSWQEVEIISSDEGAPQLHFRGRAAELVTELGIARSHVSLSHSHEQAVAMVVLESG
jgi:holo-[acyl-carrier protein] synthase